MTSRTRRNAFLAAVATCFAFVSALPSGAGGQAVPGRPASQRGRPDAGGFTLAVVRRDGIVIPFAGYDGGRWSNSWPVPGKRLAVPLGMLDVPADWWPARRAITSWTVWPFDTTPSQVESIAPAVVRAECQPGLGIRTTYTPVAAAPAQLAQPYPKDGLATHGDVSVEPTPALEPSDRLWAQVQPVMQRAVALAEDRAIAGALKKDSWPHPIPRAERGQTAFIPEVILQVSGRAIYFEGVKTYSPAITVHPAGGGWRIQRFDVCNLLTHAAGWVFIDGTGTPQAKAEATISDCNRSGITYVLPLGVIQRGETAFWVVQVAGYGYERYEVIEVAGDRVRSAIATPGGRCAEEVWLPWR